MTSKLVIFGPLMQVHHNLNLEEAYRIKPNLKKTKLERKDEQDNG